MPKMHRHNKDVLNLDVVWEYQPAPDAEECLAAALDMLLGDHYSDEDSDENKQQTLF
jgi:hypothetical protein